MVEVSGHAGRKQAGAGETTGRITSRVQPANEEVNSAANISDLASFFNVLLSLEVARLVGRDFEGADLGFCLSRLFGQPVSSVGLALEVKHNKYNTDCAHKNGGCQH